MGELTDVTTLLSEVRSGSKDSENRLLELVYRDLHRIAQRFMRSERAGHSLQATELVNEAYLRIIRSESKSWKDRAHFFAIAAQVMRRILVDYARSRKAGKRDGGDRVNLDDANLSLTMHPDQVLLLDAALRRLADWDLRRSRVVEMRVFAGLTETEIAEVLGVATRTVKRDWRMARAWLYGELQQHAGQVRTRDSGSEA
jgi:RNA polymerase sigma factor (TIGR02999 family)